MNTSRPDEPSQAGPPAGFAGGVAEQTSSLLAAIRKRRPLIHHFANYVTMQVVASVTRASGALPVMALAGVDAEQMVGQAGALVLSLGTPTPDRLDAMLAAGRVAATRRIPIVLDPVGAGATAYRDATARALLDQVPVGVIRANRGEAAALLGQPGGVRGVESVAEARGADGEALARRVAQRFRCVAAVTGPRDDVADSARHATVERGHVWLEAVSGAGCMVTALVGAFCAVSEDYFGATVAALTAFGAAAEIAARRAAGPGTLVPALLDALYHLSPEDLWQAGRAKES